MFVYMMISIINNRSANAAPIILDRADPPQGMNSPLRMKRTMFGIVWSCLSTIIICAWTSVHPNVPPPSKWKARWNRLRLMFWMVVAPELVLAWAVRQYFAAREIRNTYNERHPDPPQWKKWTLAHGHLLQMGGFTLVDPDHKDAEPGERKGVVLTFEDLKRNSNIDLPEISTADIEDRSKGDALWKIIAILQTTWFIIQCIARAQQGLALTELELVTLALASLNAVTFAIWWHKPLGVQEPIRIYIKLEAPNVDDIATRQVGIAARNDISQHDHNLDLSFSDIIIRYWRVVRLFAKVQYELCTGYTDSDVGYLSTPIALTYIFTSPFFLLFPLGIVLLLKMIKTQPVPQESSQSRGLLATRIVATLRDRRFSVSSAVGNYVGSWLEEIFDGEDILPFLFGWFTLLPLLFVLLLFFTAFLTPFLTLLFLVSFIFTAVFGIVTSSTIRPGASHVPSFYAPTTKSDHWSRMVVFALFGVIFGGLHCVGWNFEFPTNSEKALWRATSFAITVIPLVVAPIDFLLASRLRTRDVMSCKLLERSTLLALDLIMTVLLFAYVPARLSLIAQSLALLRHQPATALIAVDWTKYVPHLFSQ